MSFFGGIKRTTGDKYFSDYIREKANWTCERCGKVFDGPHAAIQNSHYFTRGNPRVRFDPDNCSCLCVGCHDWFTKNPHDHSEFMRRKLGEVRYDALVLRSNMRRTEKLDHKLEAIKWRLALKEMRLAKDGIVMGRKA